MPKVRGLRLVFRSTRLADDSKKFVSDTLQSLISLLQLFTYTERTGKIICVPIQVLLMTKV
jgi:hypothetical protein